MSEKTVQIQGHSSGNPEAHAVWDHCVDMSVCPSITVLNTFSPYRRLSLISLRENREWEEIFRSWVPKCTQIYMKVISIYISISL